MYLPIVFDLLSIYLFCIMTLARAIVLSLRSGFFPKQIYNKMKLNLNSFGCRGNSVAFAP